MKIGRQIRIRKEDLKECMKPIYPAQSAIRIQPTLEPPSAKELERRKTLVERILKRRAEMASIDVAAAELVKEGRKGARGSL